MGWSHKSIATRIMSFFLLCVLMISTATPVYAAQATTEEGVGTSLYSVTTALTAFANNVVGANTNDKHSDDAGGDKDHKLWELSNAVPTGSVEVGDAGAIVGYGDKAKGFIAYISANETRSVTTSSYGAYLNLGENGKTYAYVRYGRLLTELGIDQTGQPDGGGGLRKAGFLLQGGYVLSSFVPTLFDTCVDVLRLLNPFRFLVDQTAVSGAITDWNTSGGTSVGTVTDPFTGTAGDATIDTGDVTAQEIGRAGESGHVEEYGNAGLEGALGKIAESVTDIYVRLRQIGLILIIPLMLVFLVAGVLLTASSGGIGNMDNRRRLKAFLIRLVFIVIGIPMLGILYTATLDEVQSTILTQSPSSRILAASFVDFENWVKLARLDPPNNVTLVSEGISESETQGRASGDSWRTVRETIYQINYRTNLYGIPDDSGIGLGAGEVDTNAGMWDTNGQYTSFGTDAANRKVLFNRMNTLLTAYSNAAMYTASAWESNVNSSLTANFSDDLGSTQSTDPASSNKKTIYQMYFDTDEVDDWMNRSAENNGEIFDSDVGGGDGPEEAKWAHMEWNIFCNGSSLGVASIATDGNGHADPEQDFTYSPSGATWTDAINPSSTGGLSTVSMYNYLASAFNETNISVYSAMNTTSEYTRQQHFSVNLAGSGILNLLFFANCCVCLLVFVILGFVYCVGMMIHNLKTGISMIMAIPGAMLGVLKSIAQVVVYVIKMIIELLGTMFLYQFMADLVLVFATVVESPIMDRVKNVDATAIAGGLFANTGVGSLIETLAANHMFFVFGMGAVALGLIGTAVAVVKLRRPVLVVWAYAWMRIMRMVTFAEFVPVFDEVMARRTGLYVWDEVSEDLTKAVSVCGDIICDAESSVVKGGAVKC